MIEPIHILVFFGSIISLLLSALITIVWYWARRVDDRFQAGDKRISSLERSVSIIEERCKNRRVTDSKSNFYQGIKP